MAVKGLGHRNMLRLTPQNKCVSKRRLSGNECLFFNLQSVLSRCMLKGEPQVHPSNFQKPHVFIKKKYNLLKLFISEQT